MSETNIATQICPTCGKPVKGARRGTFTGWIFGDPSSCTCGKRPSDSLGKGGQSSSYDDTLIGQVLEKRYKVVKVIGKGGMGSVYLVEDQTDGKVCALKTLDPLAVDLSSWMRLEKEARAAGRLDHEGLIKVFASGLIEGSRPYFVMEYIEGETLAERIKRAGALPVDEALPLFIQVCFALGYAHQKGVVHRDLKPSNIILRPPGPDSSTSIKIVDFGIAKISSSEEAETLSLTSEGEIFGTPYYMSPEQCLGGTVDYRSDIYSLGCVMFEALTGTPPFVGDTALALMMKHQAEKAPTLKEGSIGVDFPDALEKMIAKLLQKDPGHRYSGLSELAMDLDCLRSGRPVKVKMTAAPQPKSGPDPVGIISGGIVLAGICLFAGYLAGSQMQEPEKKAHSDQQPIVARPLSDRILPYSILETIDGNRFRSFNIPDARSWVSLRTAGSMRRASLSESGRLLFPEAAGVSAEMSLLRVSRRPELLLGFAHDDLIGIKFHDPTNECDEELVDDLMVYLARLHSLKSLTMNHTPISDKGLGFLADMPDLQTLDLAQTKITEKGLLGLKCLRALKSLNVGPMDGLHKVMRAISPSDHLQVLVANGCNLNSDDIGLIKNMPALIYLRVSDNPKVTDRDVEKLTGLKALRSLGLENTAITDAIVPVLKKFPVLKMVYVSKGALHDTSMQQLTSSGINVEQVGSRAPEDEAANAFAQAP